MKWKTMDSAPQDGTSFIGKMKSGLVFVVSRGKYRTFMSESEKIEFRAAYGTTPFHPTRMTEAWNRKDEGSLLPCDPVGWIPMPE